MVKPLRGTPLNRTHPLSRNLVGCWVMNEGTGSVLQDYSSHGYAASLSKVTWAAGLRGTACAFNGTDSRGLVGDVRELNAAPVFSIFLRLCQSDTAADDQICWKRKDASYEIRIATWSDLLQCNVGNGAWNTFGRWAWGPAYGGPATDDTWHDVALVYDGSGTGNSQRLKCYIDGALQTAYSWNQTIPDTTADLTGYDLYLGYMSGSFGGRITCCYLWSRALRPGEIGQLYRDPFAMLGHRAPVWVLPEFETVGPTAFRDRTQQLLFRDHAERLAFQDRTDLIEFDARIS